MCHDNAKSYPCSTCGKKFANPKCRWTHEKIHATKPRYICPFCGQRFISPARLRRHRRREHPNREKGRLKDILGQYPGEKIIRIPPCYVHLQRLSPSQIRKLREQISNDKKHPANETNIRRDMRTKKKNYILPSCKKQCVFCGAISKTNQDFYHHICSHIGERWYNCRYCSDSFGHGTSLWQHERRHKNQTQTLGK